MSEDSVGLVRRAYDTWNERGPGAITAMLAPDVELHDAPQLPDAQVWRGRHLAVDRLQTVADAVGGGYVKFQAFTPQGGAVLVDMCWELGDEAEHAQLGRVFHLVDVAGGSITRIRVFLTEAEARGAT
jgi:ketosteroid isomerase-like protein